jgi:hypothetical protein
MLLLFLQRYHSVFCDGNLNFKPPRPHGNFYGTSYIVEGPNNALSPHSNYFSRPELGKSAKLSFAPKISGEFLSIWRNFPKSANSSAEHRRNLPKLEEIRPKFLGANLNYADSPGSPEKIFTVNVF